MKSKSKIHDLSEVADSLALGFWTGDTIKGFSQTQYMALYAALGRNFYLEISNLIHTGLLRCHTGVFLVRAQLSFFVGLVHVTGDAILTIHFANIVSCA